MSRLSEIAESPGAGPRDRTCRFLIVCLAFFFVVSLLRAEKLVALQAIADAAYLKRRFTANPPEVETYVLFKGQYTAGVDPGLKKTPFGTIVGTLSVDLLSQRFSPAASAATADLVIVVHWGMTKENSGGAALLQYDPDALRQASEAVTAARENEAADLSGTTRSLGASAAAEAKYKTESQVANSLYAGNGAMAASNAELLGFQSALARDDEVGDTVRAMLTEERYFIILIAYDGPALRAGTKRQVWITRMSIRSAGVNFPIALDRMSSVAANFYGSRQRDIVLVDSRDRRIQAKPENVIVIGDKPSAAAETKR